MQWWVVRRKIHVSWLVALLSLSLVIGVILTQWWSGWNQLMWLLVGVTTCGVAMWRRSVYLLPLLVVGGLILGLWRGSIDRHERTVYRNIYDSAVVITGVVSDDADTGKGGALVLRVKGVVSDGHALPGKLWISANTKYDIKRGDMVTLKGKLQAGFGNFAGVMYRANVVKVQRPEPGDVARRVRDWFADNIRLAIPDPQASLGIGYLVGQRRALPPELDQALQIAGLTHIVVASGYNLTILVRLARRLFVKISKYLSALSASTMIAAFVAVTGASPSMSRAGLVAGLSLAAWYYGRKFHPLVLLPFAAGVTVLIDPSYAWNDLGWQLSFAAFAGVMIMAPLLQRYYFGDTKPGLLRQIAGETISAFLMTLPILVVAFGQVSNVAILANMLVLPLVPLAMLLTFVAGLGAIFVPSVATIVGTPASLLLGYMVQVAEYLSKLPWALAEVELGSWFIAVSYSLIGAVLVWMWRATKYNLRDSNIVE